MPSDRIDGTLSGNQRIGRRRFLRTVLAAGLGVSTIPLLQACSPAPSAQPTAAPAKPTPAPAPTAAAAKPTAAPAAPTAAPAATTAPKPAGAAAAPEGSPPRPAGERAPANEQVLRMLTPSPFRMDPITYAGDMWQLQIIVFQALTRFETDGKLVGGVADRWESSEGGKTWTFFLNPNAKFSDGSPITANDVKWTWDWVTNPKAKCWNPDLAGSKIVGYDKVKAGSAEALEGVVVKDARTVQFNLTSPFGGFPNLAAYFSTGVLKKDNVMSGEEWWRKPVTSGMYKVTEYTPGDQATMTLEPNEHWWGEKPILQKVTVRLVADPQTQLVIFDNNEADGMPAQPADFAQASRPGGPRSAELFWQTGTGYWYFAFITDKKPFDDVKVRQAFASAVDLKALSTAALNGIYPPLGRVLAPSFPCGGAEQWHPSFDAARAKKLIAESSYGSIDKLPKVTALVSEAGGATALGTWGKVAVALQQQLQDNLGVKLEVVRQQFGPGQMLQMARDIEGGATVRLSGGGVVPDPFVLGDAFKSGVSGNIPKYSNPKVDDLIAKGDAETDLAKRCALYAEADKIISEEAVFLAPFRDSSTWFFKQKVRGMTIMSGRFWPSLHKMYIAKA